MQVQLADELRAIVRPAVLWLDGATVVERAPALNAPLATIAEHFRLKPEATGDSDFRLKPEATGEGARDDGSGFRLQAEVRNMYKRVGLDPTKTRPSSEALLRRVRKGDPLPRINSMVDVCNWCSLEFQLPYGLYDAAHIDGDRVELRLGRDGESYPGIRKDDVHVAGRIALADASGPFGNPSSDSARTMITTATTRALLVVFAPAGTAESRLTSVLDATSARMTAFTGAREVGRQILS